MIIGVIIQESRVERIAYNEKLGQEMKALAEKQKQDREDYQLQLQVDAFMTGFENYGEERLLESSTALSYPIL